MERIAPKSGAVVSMRGCGKKGKHRGPPSVPSCKLRHRERAVIERLFTLAVAAYNLVRIRNLTAASA